MFDLKRYIEELRSVGPDRLGIEARLPIVIALAGLPGTGKSHLYKDKEGISIGTDPDNMKSGENGEFYLHSTDRLIDEYARENGMTYDEAIKANDCSLLANELLDKAFRKGLDIIWDQTNLSSGKRQKILNRFTASSRKVKSKANPVGRKYLAGCIWLSMDWSGEWVKRLANRCSDEGKCLGAGLLTRMISGDRWACSVARDKDGVNGPEFGEGRDESLDGDTWDKLTWVSMMEGREITCEQAAIDLNATRSEIEYRDGVLWGMFRKHGLDQIHNQIG